MPDKINPFRPGSTVHPGMFAGRVNEIRQIERALAQTKFANPKSFLITGERGIGKSSLLLYAKYVAEGAIRTLDGNKFDFLIMSAVVSDNETLSKVVIKLVNDYYQKEQQSEVKEFVKACWERVAEVGVGGVSIKKAEKPGPDEVYDRFVYFLEKLSKDIAGKRDGVVLVLDEVDRASSYKGFSSFIKSTFEKLHMDGCHNVLVGLAGMTEVRAKMYEDHESVLRFFDIHELSPLEEMDRNYVIESGLEEARRVNKIPTEIDPAALGRITNLSEGFPHFLQEFGYSAFEVDDDNKITEQDVLHGVVGTDTFEGALRRLGKQYFHRMYFEAIKSDEYRKVLDIFASQPPGWVSKATLKSDFKGKESTLNNALATLKERDIVVSDPTRQGYYRLPWRAFASYIRLTRRMKEEEGAKGSVNAPLSNQ
jgi:AAA+ ATPase superfamily predicted ATPase